MFASTREASAAVVATSAPGEAALSLGVRSAFNASACVLSRGNECGLGGLCAACSTQNSAAWTSTSGKACSAAASASVRGAGEREDEEHVPARTEIGDPTEQRGGEPGGHYPRERGDP